MGNIINNFDNITLLIGVITGLATSLISFVLFKFYHNRILKSVIIDYPNEKIEYEYCPIIKIISFTQFFVGVFIGGYLLPFLFFSDVTQINMVTPRTLPIYIALAIFSFAFAILLGSYTIVLTDKRLLGIFPYKILTRTELLLCDIKTVRFTKNGIDIISKNNHTFPLKSRLNAKNCYEKINPLLIMEVSTNA